MSTEDHSSTNAPGGLPPLPSAGYRPCDGDDDGFTSFDVGAGSGAGGTGPDGGGAGGAGLGGQPSGGGAQTTAAPTGAAPPDDPFVALTTGCVVMGPSFAGKTTLLLALDQACSCPSENGDSFRLELIGGQGTEELAALGINTIMKREHRILGTARTAGYAASITATQEKTFWCPAKQYVSHLVFRDGPGGALFPAELDEESFQKYLAGWETELLRDARQAETLVLCVDATDPRPDLVTRYMRKILARVAEPFTPRIEHPLGYRFLRKLRMASEIPPAIIERRIPSRRFLLLLTKIDQLVAREPDWPESAVGEHEPPTPADLAAHLSPVQTACELLDESNLLRILNALRPDADFAVGLTSAWGFNPFTGRPFMEDDEPVGLSTQDRSQRLLNWRPFGVREALLFITAGIARGPVERVNRHALGSRLRGAAFDVPPEFFDVES